MYKRSKSAYLLRISVFAVPSLIQVKAPMSLDTYNGGAIGLSAIDDLVIVLAIWEFD